MNAESSEDYILQRYNTAIEYYWKASRHNKKAYKLTRSLTVILGAVVTVVASLSSAEFISKNQFWDTTFAIAAPVLAAMLAIVGGFSQSFQWGAAWRDMVLNAQRLERERDRYRVTAPQERDPAGEVSILNGYVLEETQNFFQRIVGGGRNGREGQGAQSNQT